MMLLEAVRPFPAKKRNYTKWPPPDRAQSAHSPGCVNSMPKKGQGPVWLTRYHENANLMRPNNKHHRGAHCQEGPRASLDDWEQKKFVALAGYRTTIPRS